jgi:phosphatidylinositol phospholipase C delta
VFQIISAYQIPKPNNSKKGEVIDPFVKIEIHGVKTDQQSVKTSVIDNNGKLALAATKYYFPYSML